MDQVYDNLMNKDDQNRFEEPEDKGSIVIKPGDANHPKSKAKKRDNCTCS